MAERVLAFDPNQITRRKVVLTGRRDVMFDRYPGDNNTKLEPWQKLYYDSDGETLVLPALNIVSFLSAHNTNSAPKRLMDKRKYKDVANSMLSFVEINPVLIPFLRNGEPIKFKRLDPDTMVDPSSGVYVHYAVARLDKGVPNPKERPVLPTPWELEFELSILPNKEIQEVQIKNLFEQGGIAIGIGTFRGVFGKFEVSTWE